MDGRWRRRGVERSKKAEQTGTREKRRERDVGKSVMRAWGPGA